MVHVLQSIHQKRKFLHQSSFFSTQGKIPFMILHRVGIILSGKVKINQVPFFLLRDIHVAPERLLILTFWSSTKITNIKSSGQNHYSTRSKLYNTRQTVINFILFANPYILIWKKNLHPHALWLYNSMLCPNCYDMSLLRSKWGLTYHFLMFSFNRWMCSSE